MPELLGQSVERDKVAKTIIGHAEVMEDLRRKDFEDVKQQAVDLTCPDRGNVSDFRSGAKGGITGYDIYDDEASLSLDTCVDGLMGMHMPYSLPWFRSAFYEKTIGEVKEVRGYFQDCDEIALDILRRSDTFYERMPIALKDGLGPGDGAAYVEPDIANYTIDIIVPNIWQMYYLRDDHGKLLAIHRHYRLSAIQALRMFGTIEQLGEYNVAPEPGVYLNTGNLSSEILNNLKHGQFQHEYEFIHAVYWNTAYNPQGLGPAYMRWSSYDIQRLATPASAALLRSSGYHTQNPMVFTVNRGSGEDYGRGIAGKAIVTIATVNQLTKSMLDSAHWQADPAWKISKNLLASAELWPGGRIPIGDKDKEDAEAITMPGNTPFSVEERERITDHLKEHFMVKYFEMFTNLGKDMRVLELMEMRGEKAVMMSKFMGTVNRFIDGILDRVRNIACSAGWFPPPPQIIIDFLMEHQFGPQPMRKVNIDHIGPISQIQKQMFEMQPVQHTLAASEANFVIAPETKHHFNWDRIQEYTMKAYNFPVELENTPEEFRQQREAYIAQQQAAQVAEQAAAVADAVPKLQGKTEEGSPLAALSGAA